MEFRDPFAQAQAYSQPQAAAGFDAGLRAYMLKIYNYMASALALTGIVAMLAAGSPAFLQAMYNVQDGHAVGMSGLGWLVMLAPLGLVLWLSFGIERMSVQTAQAVYWAYAVLVGLSLSSIFLVYTGASIARAFFITAGTFGSMSIYGYTTRRDLTGMGHFLIMGLIGLILASMASFFFPSPGFSFALSVVGVLIFVGLTAWDTQKLKVMYYQLGSSGEMAAKMSIMGALRLYLDFINIFIYMLRFVGDRR
ncbi:MAG: Bax inhibitor-1/YccA family protein [Pseudomonadota bacterium]|nr:Bax inhibitor-1/YccA family protein [Pseudomonadota bacterium]